MPIIIPLVIACLTAFSSLCGLGKIVIEKFVPNKIGRKREFKTKHRVVNSMNSFQGKTQKQIARWGAKRGIV